MLFVILWDSIISILKKNLEFTKLPLEVVVAHEILGNDSSPKHLPKSLDKLNILNIQ
jgi:hypothetical protein